MIVQLSKVISCSSEHPSYPASNLLESKHNLSWRCAKPGEMLATVIFQMDKSSVITGIDIGNYRSCVVVVTASTSNEPDNWIPVLQHQFLTHDEAANNKFKDQVQIFTKREINPDILKTKFDRIKVTCMQSANLKILFGLTFFTVRTETMANLGSDIFGRFQLKEQQQDTEKNPLTEFKERYLKTIESKKADPKNELLCKIKESGMSTFVKKQEGKNEPMKRPLLAKLEAGKSEEVFGNEKCNNANKATTEKLPEDKSNESSDFSFISIGDKEQENVKRTPFGDVIPSPQSTSKKNKQERRSSSYKRSVENEYECIETSERSKKKKNNYKENLEQKSKETERPSTSNMHLKKENEINERISDEICLGCDQLKAPEGDKNGHKKNMQRRVKPFNKLMDNVTFSMSGYVNPQRNNIRKKALAMGARYIAEPKADDGQCTHLICAFKNTPKYALLKDHVKIVSHTYIEDCFNKRKRIPWRRYALDKEDREKQESEEEIEAGENSDCFTMDTDPSSPDEY